jgi:hypothetical protein
MRTGRKPKGKGQHLQAPAQHIALTHRMEITGPAADRVGPQVGPEISGDFPQVLAALVERAES